MTEATGRVVGLDLGSSRIGVALTDELGLTAQPHGVIERAGSRHDLDRIRAIVEDTGAVRVVVGHPLLLSGERGEGARRAERFVAALRRAVRVPVELWDERLTTVQAERILVETGASRRRRRETVDALAASIILQSWLASHGQTSSST